MSEASRVSGWLNFIYLQPSAYAISFYTSFDGVFFAASPPDVRKVYDFPKRFFPKVHCGYAANGSVATKKEETAPARLRAKPQIGRQSRWKQRIFKA